MEKLYHETNKLLHEVQNGLSRVEQASQEKKYLAENEVQAMIDQIVSNLERLDILVNKEPATRKQNARLRLEQLKYDCQHLQAALRNIQHRRYMHEQELKDRDELLTRRFVANDDNTSVLIDQELSHNSSLHDAHRGMDDLIGAGAATIENLRNQRGLLKGTQRKILDVANVLGLSNTVMRLIEKRTAQDKWILFGGMFVTCVVMYLCYAYLT
ncbi:Golgi SNAP receptor complex member 2-like [Patiria miniata]|uniref:Golgi SNAP receptor complex member 2 n=1 Tax=Patiria miniata TaxID=46514 RepID=A0A913ZAE1_PATMI|nr:Golgi SNAP receptor complex member 2-like [Patiria miniata]